MMNLTEPKSRTLFRRSLVFAFFLYLIGAVTYADTTFNFASNEAKQSLDGKVSAQFTVESESITVSAIGQNATLYVGGSGAVSEERGLGVNSDIGVGGFDPALSVGEALEFEFSHGHRPSELLVYHKGGFIGGVAIYGDGELVGVVDTDPDEWNIIRLPPGIKAIRLEADFSDPNKIGRSSDPEYLVRVINTATDRLLWARTYDEFYAPSGIATAVDIAGSECETQLALVAGQSSDSLFQHPGEFFSVRAYQVQSGERVWSNVISFKGRALDVDANESGTVIAVGHLSNRYFVAAYDTKPDGFVEQRVRWNVTAGNEGSASAVVVGRDRAWVAGTVDNSLLVRAYMTETGAKIWTHTAEDVRFAGRNAIVRHRHLLFVAGTIIRAGDNFDMYLAAFNVYTGKLQWERYYDSGGDDEIVSLAYADGQLFAAGRRDGDYAVHAYDAFGGSLVWVDYSGLGGWGSADRIAAESGRVFVAGRRFSEFSDGRYLVRSYNACCGQMLWEHRFTARRNVLDRPLSIDINAKRLYVLGLPGPPGADLDAIRSMEVYKYSSGRLLWRDEFNANGLREAIDVMAWDRRVVAVGGFEDEGFLRTYCDRKCGN